MNSIRNIVLIATTPGPLMDSLKALLSTVPQIEQVISIDDTTTLPHAIAEYKPRLVLLDYDSVTSAIGNIFEQTRRQAPDIHYFILIDSIEEQHRVEMVEDVTILRKGSSPAELFSVVENLLSH